MDAPAAARALQRARRDLTRMAGVTVDADALTAHALTVRRAVRLATLQLARLTCPALCTSAATLAAVGVESAISPARAQESARRVACTARLATVRSAPATDALALAIFGADTMARTVVEAQPLATIHSGEAVGAVAALADTLAAV